MAVPRRGIPFGSSRFPRIQCCLIGSSALRLCIFHQWRTYAYRKCVRYCSVSVQPHAPREGFSRRRLIREISARIEPLVGLESSIQFYHRSAEVLLAKGCDVLGQFLSRTGLASSVSFSGKLC